jgi:hypothetical protein
MTDTEILDWLEKNFDKVLIFRIDNGKYTFKRLMSPPIPAKPFQLDWSEKTFTSLRELVEDANK